jgi:hypothetical protein
VDGVSYRSSKSRSHRSTWGISLRWMNLDKKGYWSAWDSGEDPSDMTVCWLERESRREGGVAEVAEAYWLVSSDSVGCGSDRTAMGRSEGDDWLVRRGVGAAEDAAVEEGWGVFGSQVTRLHGTSWRAQLEHGLSSSHWRLPQQSSSAGQHARLAVGLAYLDMASLALAAAQA